MLTSVCLLATGALPWEEKGQRGSWAVPSSLSTQELPSPTWGAAGEEAEGTWDIWPWLGQNFLGLNGAQTTESSGAGPQGLSPGVGTGWGQGGCTHQPEALTSSTLGPQQGRHEKGPWQKRGRAVRSWQVCSNVSLNTSTGRSVCSSRGSGTGCAPQGLPPAPALWPSHQPPPKPTAPGMASLLFA